MFYNIGIPLTDKNRPIDMKLSYIDYNKWLLCDFTKHFIIKMHTVIIIEGTPSHKATIPCGVKYPATFFNCNNSGKFPQIIIRKDLSIAHTT